MSPEHAPNTDRASGCHCVAPSGRNATALGLSRRLLTRLHVAGGHTATSTRAMPPLHGVASLHAIIFAIPAHRHPRLPSRCLPWCRLPCPRKVFVNPPGSSSPTSSTTAAPLQVTCMTTFGHRRSRRLHHHLRPLRLCHQRHRLVLNHTCSSTLGITDDINTSLFTALCLATVLEPPLLVSLTRCDDHTGPILPMLDAGNTSMCFLP
jgi:hypothetical protein